MYVLGIDTSNYTTSVALIDEDENIIFDKRRMLDVKKGERGLRQQEALFQHVNNLPALIHIVINDDTRDKIGAVSFSSRPRPVDGSYMPCFLAGQGTARAVAAALGVSCFEYSHQEGHVAAVAPQGLKDFLCYHLSGGTGELLKVHIKEDDQASYDNSGASVRHTKMDIKIIGATKDISPGQLIDRAGVAMGYGFPAGKEMDDIACGYSDYIANTGSDNKDKQEEILTGVRLDGLDFSLSGMERQVLGSIGKYDNDILIAQMFKRLSVMLVKLTEKARKETGLRDTVFAGGVSMSKYVRSFLSEKLRDIYFGDNASDNAVGTAILGMRNLKE